MKKVILGMILVSAITLAGCSNGEAKKQVTEQSKTIESLEKTIESLESEKSTLESEQETMVTVAVGDAVPLSGEITVGTDIPAGVYDLKLSSGGGHLGVYSAEGSILVNELFGDPEAEGDDEYISEYKSLILHESDKVEMSSVTVEFSRVS